MFKHTQTINRLLPTNYLVVFDHFVGLVLNGLRLQILPNNIHSHMFFLMKFVYVCNWYIQPVFWQILIRHNSSELIFGNLKQQTSEQYLVCRVCSVLDNKYRVLLNVENFWKC